MVSSRAQRILSDYSDQTDTFRARGTHESVLLQEVIAGLAIEENDIVVDGTINGGGHSEALSRALGARGILIGIDLDGHALERSRKRLAGLRSAVHLVHDNFRNLPDILHRLNILHVHKILLDLGWSRDQIESGGRGFTFSSDEPLYMTYADDPVHVEETASDIVNRWKEEEIAELLYAYAEEKFSRRIARAIISARRLAPIETSGQLATIISDAVPEWYRFRRVHPATKTFQALRMAVNDELGALKEGIPNAIRCLSPNGRLAIISFHSVEDRIVKRILKEACEKGEGILLNKKPIVPLREEIARNRASRSAKLRLFQKNHVTNYSYNV